MLFDLPPKRYKSYPAALIGDRKARFRDRRGHFAAFDRRKVLTLVLPFRSYEEAFLSLTVPAVAKPSRGLVAPVSPVKKPKQRWKVVKPVVKPPRRHTASVSPAKKPKQRRKVEKPVIKSSTLWIHTNEIFRGLLKQYPDLKIGEQIPAMQGWMYMKKGIYRNTIWPTQKIDPQMSIKSCFIFAIFQQDDKYEDTPLMLAGAQVGWYTTPAWVVNNFAGMSRARRAVEGTPLLQSPLMTNRESLLYRIFPGLGDIEKFVGVRFSKKKAPKVIRNPKGSKKNERDKMRKKKKVSSVSARARNLRLR